MKVVIEGMKSREPQVGDIIQYENTTHREHPFYIICSCQDLGFFVMSLTGKKTKMRSYSTIRGLMSIQKDVKKVYSREEWQLKLAAIES